MVDLVLERALHEALDLSGNSSPPILGEALAYAVFPGGARVRPRLCLEVARACGSADDLAYVAACSVELLHCASLAHDDLPCFDGADTRRGRPSVHRAYGEATAVLVGDGLIVQAFHALARAVARRPELGIAPVVALVEAAGPRVGLVAGQAWEQETVVNLATYHRAKTASLFECAASLGAIVGGVPASPFAELGRSFGMTYQLADDVADAIGDAAALGKPTGRDRALGRPSAAGAPGDAASALDQLDRAVEETVNRVPICPGEGELRRFVRAVFDALAARIKSTDPHPATRLPRTSAHPSLPLAPRAARVR
jgi:geranylgeranyl diphosphate synthase type II